MRRCEWELPKERKAFFETPGQQYDSARAAIRSTSRSGNCSTRSTARRRRPRCDTIVSAWANGDVEAIAATNLPQTPDDVAETQHVLFDRNANWIPAIEKLLADNQQDLIVVGAAHLAGPGSVLDLLAKAGYTVTRVQ